jgi:putrescine aminotransferase
MVCVENVANKATKEPLPDGVNESKRISTRRGDGADGAADRAPERDVAALTITEGQVDFVVETLEKAIRKVTDELVREGHRIG